MICGLENLLYGKSSVIDDYENKMFIEIHLNMVESVSNAVF